MRVFVTGVGGQLGHDVMDELARRGIEAVGSDIHGMLDTPYAYRQLDITDPDVVRRVLTDVGCIDGALRAFSVQCPSLKPYC